MLQYVGYVIEGTKYSNVHIKVCTLKYQIVQEVESSMHTKYTDTYIENAQGVK